jgi:hypothetical protein
MASSRHAAASTSVVDAPDTFTQDPGDGAAGGGLLGTTRINPPPLVRGGLDQPPSIPGWWAARRLRYLRRQTSSTWLIGAARAAVGLPEDAAEGSAWVEPARPARCRWRVAEGVGVHWSAGRPAHWSGLERCASIWACAVCSAVIRHGRSIEVQAAADQHASSGGFCVMVTVTLRHRVGDALAVTLDQALRAWDGVVRNRRWRVIREAYGVVGYIRACEVTHGGHGWHPHIHALLFVGRELTGAELDEMQLALFVAWQTEVTRQGGRGLSVDHGVRVTRAGSAAAAYVAKVQEHDRVVNAGLEMTRFDLKAGRRNSSTPFELLDHKDNRALWLEYVAATKGRRAITWSRGLRALLGLDQEATDAEIIADTETSDLVGVLSAADYDAIRNHPEILAELLEIVEQVRSESLT